MRRTHDQLCHKRSFSDTTPASTLADTEHNRLNKRLFVEQIDVALPCLTLEPMTNTSGLATGETKSTKKDRALLLGAAPLIAVVAVVVVAVLAGWALVSSGWVSSSSDYVTLVGRGGFTGLGALAIAVLLHYRWMIDRKTQIEQEQNRLNEQDRLERARTSAEQRRHRDQERGKRQEKMGDRMAQAISHLGEGRGFMQVSGLIELAGLVDDWWSLGQEMLADMPDTDEAERERVREMIRQRRQEIIDLMFKHTLSPDGVNASNNDSETTAEAQRRKMVQEARVQSLTSHLPEPVNGDVPQESWANLDLSRAYLKGADVDLTQINLSGATLYKAHFDNANLTEAELDGADLTGAHMNDAILTEADLRGAHLHDAEMNDATLFSAHLEGAHLSGAKLNEAILVWAHLEGAHLDTADLIGAFLNEAHMNKTDLYMAKMRGAHLNEAILISAVLTGADLRGAELEGADLRGADLRRATLDDHYAGSPIYDKDTKFPEGYDPEAAGFKLKDDD